MRLPLGQAVPILLVHGSPYKVTVGFTPELTDAQLRRLLAGVRDAVVIGAHTHQPMDRWVDGQRVMNPGSVGMPYNGDPRAQYLLLDAVGDALQATFRQVEYPIDLVRAEFERLDLTHTLGLVAALHLQTVETGLPWISDFVYWMRDQPANAVDNMDLAVATYMGRHGPGRWAFAPE
jgi:diadenosine tetraphosphatase ApaH/serine/threonine PP2A family protein phosphatase